VQTLVATVSWHRAICLANGLTFGRAPSPQRGVVSSLGNYVSLKFELVMRRQTKRRLREVLLDEGNGEFLGLAVSGFNLRTSCDLGALFI
jgi:hypothetical protein